MNNQKQFMVVKDKVVADKLKSGGFQLVSEANGIYMFINSTPQNFNFNEVDVTKIAYTNMLSI